MAHRVTFIPGDGTGPEIADATKRVLDATGVDFDWDVQEAGVDVMDQRRHPAARRRDRVDQATPRSPSRGRSPRPSAPGFRSVNVALRKALDLYACVRPCKSYEGVRSRYEDIDLVFVRENTEDLYAGIEFEKGTPEDRRADRRVIELTSSGRAASASDAGISIKPISVDGTRRIVHVRLRLRRASNGRTQGHRGAQGQHHEVHRRPLLAVAQRGREGLPGHRVRGPHRRQHVHAARAEARSCTT